MNQLSIWQKIKGLRLSRGCHEFVAQMLIRSDAVRQVDYRQLHLISGVTNQCDDTTFKCLRCGECCGPHYVTPEEEEIIDEFLKDRHIDKRPHKSLFDKCPYFEDLSCLIYPVRPLVCRLMGITYLMPCSRGCRPAQMMSAEEAARTLLEQ